MGFDFDAMFETVAGQLGESFTVTDPAGGDPTVVTGTWIETNPQPTTEGGDTTNRRREACVIRVAALAHVAVGATILRHVTGETWTAIDVQMQRGVAHRIDVERIETYERTRGKYR